MKKNKIIMSLLTAATLLSLTACSENESESPKKKTEITQTNVQSKEDLLREQEIERELQEQRALNEELNQKWTSVEQLGVPGLKVLRKARSNGLIKGCFADCKCPQPHEGDPNPEFGLICDMEKSIRKVLPDYDLYPRHVQAVLLQTEALAGIKDFPKMVDAIKKKDFITAASECELKYYPQTDSARKKALLMEASKQQLIKKLIEQKLIKAKN
jgi:hypothetical protein